MIQHLQRLVDEFGDLPVHQHVEDGAYESWWRVGSVHVYDGSVLLEEDPPPPPKFVGLSPWGAHYHVTVGDGQIKESKGPLDEHPTE